MRPRLLSISFLLAYLSCFSVATAEEHVHGENCGCAHKKPQPPALIEDPNDVPPDTCAKGFSRYIPDPNSVKPSYWEEDEDGPWHSELVENPAYSWQPKLISNPDYVPPAPSEYWAKLAAEVEEATPWVTLGVLLVSIFAILPLPLDMLRSQLSGEGAFSAVKAGILGLATPLCSCGSLPIAAGLIDYGVPLSSVVAFLTASQSAGLDSAVITFGLLGPTATLARLMGALILAVVAGTVLQSSSSGRRPYKQSAIPITKNEVRGSGGLIIRIGSTLVDTATDIFPLVLLGLALSTAAIHFIPMLTAPFQATRNYPWLSDILIRIGVISSTLPLQLCEHSSAALAAGIQEAGAGAGLAFAFLILAPATNLPSLLLLARASGSYNRLTPVKVALSLASTALLLSYCVDMAEIDLHVEKEAESGGEMAVLPSQFVRTSPYISGLLVGGGLLRMIRKKLTKDEQDCCATPCDKKAD